MHKPSSYSYTSIAYNGIKFLLKYSPNYQEIIFRISMKAGFETIFAPFVEFLTKDGNPTITTIIRDVLMLPEVVINAYNRQEISKTGITYDGFSVVGTLSRGGCKAVLLSNADSVELAYNTTLAQFGYDNHLNITPHALAGRFGNYVCEYGSLAVNVLSREKQLKLNEFVLQSTKELFGKEHTMFGEDSSKVELSNVMRSFKEMIHYPSATAIDKFHVDHPEVSYDALIPALADAEKFENQGYLKYTIENFNFFETVKTVVPGALIRSVIADQVGEVVKWGKSLEVITKPYYYIDGKKNELISYVFNITELNSDDNLGVQREKIYQEADYGTAFVVDAILLSSGAIYRIGREIVEANIMIPPVKAGYDLVVYYGMQDYPLQTAAAVSTVLYLYSLKNEIASYAKSQIEYFYSLDNSQTQQECVGESCPLVNDEL